MIFIYTEIITMGLIEVLGGFSIMVGGLIWIAKLILNKLFDYQVELLKQKNQIVFSKLHEERTKVIIELYKKIVEIQQSLNTTTYKSFLNNEKDNLKEFLELISNSFEYYSFNKIFFSTNFCNSIQKFFDGNFRVWIGLNGISNPEIYSQEQKIQKLVKIKEETLEELNNLMSNLENEFRTLIGVS